MKKYVESSFGTKGSKVVIVVFLVLLISLSACGALFVFYSDTASENQASITTASVDYNTFVFSLKDKNITLNSGETKTLEAEYDKEDAKDSIEWTSSNPEIAHIDPNGNIFALKKGKTTITATAGYYSSSCNVKVNAVKEKTTKGFSTAYTANAVTVKKNKNSNSNMNLYYIKVNRLKNCVTVYTYDDKNKYTIPVRAMICSCGEDNGTPLGDFTVSVKNRWHPLFGNVFGQYVTEFNGSILFHSVPYETSEDPSTVEVSEYNGLGKSISMGCVRLAVADSKWIYENCDAGTGVTVYEDEEDGPLGTPSAMTINTNSNTYWDPTDDNKKNPYYNKTPSFKGVDKLKIDKGDYFDPMNGVTATDTSGSDISKQITVEGSVNTDKKGEYLIKYSVTDALNRSASIYRYITVK